MRATKPQDKQRPCAASHGPHDVQKAPYTLLKRTCSAASSGLLPKWMTYLPASVKSSLSTTQRPFRIRMQSKVHTNEITGDHE